MPIYEYQCQQCGHHHEALQKLSDPQLRQCPECGRKSLKRLVSAVRFRLAGSGWYETDFKSDKEAKRNLHEKADKDEAKADGSGGSEAGTKSEAKDAAKPDAKGDSAKSDSAKSDSAKSASSEPTGSGKRSRVSRPATTPVRSKSNGRTKPARRAPAVRRRGR
jgi:putative FmdB family regulatory protein